jgi:hypothetical protein
LKLSSALFKQPAMSARAAIGRASSAAWMATSENIKANDRNKNFITEPCCLIIIRDAFGSILVSWFRLNFCKEFCLAFFAPKEHRKLASHKAAGKSTGKKNCPERTPENIGPIPPCLQARD